GCEDYIQSTCLKKARSFLYGLTADSENMLKAMAGGGGRGMRVVDHPSQLEEAFARCSSEARAAFGSGELYVERLIRNARHIEVQIAGDGQQVVHLWERDCTLQRRHQKLLEVAPAPGLAPRLREQMLDAAVKLTSAAG